MGHLQLKRFGTIAVGALLASTLTIHLPTTSTKPYLSFTSEAFARSSGGRSGGGSFRSSPSRSSGSSRSSSPSRRDFNPSYPSRDRSYNNGPVIVPVPVGPGVYGDPYRRDPYRSYGNSSTATAADDGSWIVGLLFLGVSLAVVVAIAYFVYRAMRKRGGSMGGGELLNDTVTVSKIQVALLAQARAMQSELTELSLSADTDTPEGLQELVQESALALLRTPENWSHVLATSQTVKSLDAAEQLFNQLSIAERSKFSVETLTNVGGRVKRQDTFKPDPDEGPASYIVVTLLLGTAHDQPLFQSIRNEQELTAVLEKLAALPADYLMVFELLWSPQDASDSLTHDELLTEYTDMIQI